MTLMELKRALEEQSGIPPDQARLIYFGKMLMDDRYEIVDNRSETTILTNAVQDIGGPRCASWI